MATLTKRHIGGKLCYHLTRSFRIPVCPEEPALHLGIAQAIGAYFGAQIAHRLPVAQLRRLVAVALIGVGTLLVWQIIA